MAERAAPRWTERVHDVLVACLIVLRPLVWGGDATSWDSLAYVILTAAAGALVVAEGWCRWRRAWRWNWGGVLAAALLAVLALAAVRSATPAAAWGTWGMALADLALAAYLMQTLPGRARLAWAALVTGLAVLGVVAALQYGVVLPAMRTALAHGDPTLTRLENGHRDLAERLQYGGVFATFTLANTFAAYLLLTLPPLVAALWRRSPPWPRALAAVVALLGALALLATGAKGAYLALALAAVLCAAGALRGWGRLLPPAVLLLAIATACASSHVRAALALSAQVRLGYWQGAIALIGESPWLGHGLGGFAAGAPRAMPLSAEPTRFAHDEPLEAWCDAGILAAVLLIALLVRLVPPRGAAQQPAGLPLAAPAPTPEDAGRARIAAAALLVLVPLFGALGMLASNLEWWPGADGDAGWLTWMLAVAALCAGALLLSTRLPLPPAWAWRLALAACALHCLIDFDLHSPGVRGCLVIIACCATPSARTLAITIPRQLATTLVAAGLLMVLALGVQRALMLGAGEAIAGRLAELRSALTPAAAPAAAAEAAAAATALCALLQLPQPSGSAGDLAAIDAAALARLDEISWRWPRSSELAFTALTLRPPGATRLELGDRLRALMPADAGLRDVQAQDLAALGRYPEAILAQRAAVERAPANLARRLALARLLERAGLGAEAERERAAVEALTTVVNPRNLP